MNNPSCLLIAIQFCEKSTTKPSELTCPYTVVYIGNSVDRSSVVRSPTNIAVSKSPSHSTWLHYLGTQCIGKGKMGVYTNS